MCPRRSPGTVAKPADRSGRRPSREPGGSRPPRRARYSRPRPGTGAAVGRPARAHTRCDSRLRCPASRRVGSRASSTGAPAIERNRSPGRTPTSAAGLSDSTREAKTPASESAHVTPSSRHPETAALRPVDERQRAQGQRYDGAERGPLQYLARRNHAGLRLVLQVSGTRPHTSFTICQLHVWFHFLRAPLTLCCGEVSDCPRSSRSGKLDPDSGIPEAPGFGLLEATAGGRTARNPGAWARLNAGMRPGLDQGPRPSRRDPRCQPRAEPCPG